MRICGVGCSVVDYLYAHIDFSSRRFRRYCSKRPGDGGLTPGKLVFTEELEAFAGQPFADIQRAITKGVPPDAQNIGGPAIVALILASQMLAGCGRQDKVVFYGAMGDDDAGRFMRKTLARMRLNTDEYRTLRGDTPSTAVFSDPTYDRGHGERTFANRIGVSWNYGPQELPGRFFESDIILFGGTALTPQLHDHLAALLKKGKSSGCVTVVTTVYDFRNEKKNPGARWPLGESNESFQNMDLLITDREEALKISGVDGSDKACQFFIESGTPAFLITHGPNPVRLYSRGGLFKELPLTEMPASKAVTAALKQGKSKGDTTGCGDNFAGGVLASLAHQMRGRRKREALDLARAVALGVCAGGAACFQMGGVALEKKPGDKLRKILDYYAKYRRQVAGQIALPAEAL
ncbi:MAG: carbohydrate kinase family protein [Candidatus Sumerlaeota bacterium]|nr:carbohydrate kinase family protein [Candidatus Sumerlaeota bacterium]